MPFIKTIPPRKATGDTAEVYRYMTEVGGGGPAPNIVQMFSLRAGSMRRMIRTWEVILWCDDEPRAPRELLAAVVSRYNDCHY